MQLIPEQLEKLNAIATKYNINRSDKDLSNRGVLCFVSKKYFANKVAKKPAMQDVPITM